MNGIASKKPQIDTNGKKYHFQPKKLITQKLKQKQETNNYDEIIARIFSARRAGEMQDNPTCRTNKFQGEQALHKRKQGSMRPHNIKIEPIEKISNYIAQSKKNCSCPKQMPEKEESKIIPVNISLRKDRKLNQVSNNNNNKIVFMPKLVNLDITPQYVKSSNSRNRGKSQIEGCQFIQTVDTSVNDVMQSDCKTKQIPHFRTLKAARSTSKINSKLSTPLNNSFAEDSISNKLEDLQIKVKDLSERKSFIHNNLVENNDILTNNLCGKENTHESTTNKNFQSYQKEAPDAGKVIIERRLYKSSLQNHENTRLSIQLNWSKNSNRLLNLIRMQRREKVSIDQ